ncbi:hypothetical protein Ait01nite_008130 [Actinoplanes italicus]|uniref:Uncharacterized protein n=1 Tax=Actinoplanes italicus TaxID=113567 RepID=A0A2T0KLJ9_9ACTN|nr:hypothetical protein [Actinoplanes italicus]PRX24505.1 hypothetical protein CLV67_102282 [Actinoplanes italicus]GIE27768.1 hypothetical protein Ait01nite_008130 [Actinoplanes italicus]
MTPEQAAANARTGLASILRAFSESPRTLQGARLLGLSGWAYHVSARAGALGEVRSETVAAVLAFIAPEAVTDGWEAAVKASAPSEVAKWHLGELCKWGADQLGGFPRLVRLLDLAGRVTDRVDTAGLPLFAAWRAMPVPDVTPGARAAVLLHLLHEHRLGVHVMAVRASGLTPLEAIIAGPEGETGAVALGWQAPYPPAGPLIRRLIWAEAVADSLAGQAYAALDQAERVEFTGLLESLGHRLAR